MIHSPTTYVSVGKASKFGADSLFHVGDAYLFILLGSSFSIRKQIDFYLEQAFSPKVEGILLLIPF